MGAVAHNRTSVKSERTALVCWGLKWEERKENRPYTEAASSQTGECLMTHTSIAAAQAQILIGQGGRIRNAWHHKVSFHHNIAVPLPASTSLLLCILF